MPIAQIKRCEKVEDGHVPQERQDHLGGLLLDDHWGLVMVQNQSRTKKGMCIQQPWSTAGVSSPYRGLTHPNWDKTMATLCQIDKLNICKNHTVLNVKQLSMSDFPRNPISH